MTDVTIGFLPKDRFHTGPAALERLLEGTAGDFRLIVIDTCTPAHYWRQMEAVLQKHPQVEVEVIRPGRFLTLGEAKNLALEASRTRLTCLIENDIFVSDGWLSKLQGTQVATDADMVAAFVMEVVPTRHHEDQNLGFLELESGPQGHKLQVRRLASPAGLDRLTTPQRVDVVETHCLLMKTDSVRGRDVFDPFINMQDFTDIGLNLKRLGASLYFEPRSIVTQMPPPEVREDERDFFMTTWDLQRAQSSLQRVMDKWDLAELPPGSLEWIQDRHHRFTRRMHLAYQLRFLLSHRWKRIPRSAVRRLQEGWLAR